LKFSFEELIEEAKSYTYFQQNGAKAHTTDNLMHILQNVFSKQRISTVWPLCS